MKKDNVLLFDDQDTPETMHDCFVRIFGNLTEEEINTEFERIFGKDNNIA